MECKKCKYNISPSDDFCVSCGHEKEGVQFFSKGWLKVGFLGISNGYYDILVDKGKLNIIKHTKQGFSAIGGFVGFLVLNFIGLFLGFYLGRNIDQRRNDKKRLEWITNTNKLISESYKKITILEIEIKRMKEFADIKKRKVVFYLSDNKKIILRGGVKRIELLNSFLNKNVL